MKMVLWLTLIAALPTPAFAYCSEPYPPRVSLPDPPGSYSKPSVPYCLSSYSYSGRHSCDQWEIDAYKRAIDDYISKLNEFVNEAYDAAQAAIKFAKDAEAYAKCEASDVTSQHK